MNNEDPGEKPTFMGQQLTGTLRYWCLHIEPYPEDVRAILDSRFPGLIPAVLTASVVEDFQNRFSPGDCFRSSTVAEFDLQNGLVRTRNSLYQLMGAGRIRYEFKPTDYAAAVGKTMWELNHKLRENLVK